MRRLFVVAGIVAASFVVSTSAPSLADRHGFYAPTPGPSAAIHVGTGTLVAWGRGNGEGSIGVRQRSGSVAFYLEARNTTIDGVVIDCFRAPEGYAKRDPQWCSSWPPYAHLGVTKVLYFYWRQNNPDGYPVVAVDRFLTGSAITTYEANRRGAQR